MKILTLLYTIPICNKLRCWLVKVKIANNYKVRSNMDILNKKQKIYDAMIIAGRNKNDLTKYEAQLNLIEWLIGEKND